MKENTNKGKHEERQHKKRLRRKKSQNYHALSQNIDNDVLERIPQTINSGGWKIDWLRWWWGADQLAESGEHRSVGKEKLFGKWGIYLRKR